MSELAYPGTLLDDEKGYRLLKCYMYKFIKNKIIRKPRFDKATHTFTEKKYFWFNSSRPLFGRYHTLDKIISFHWVLNGDFLGNKAQVFYMPQYSQGKHGKKRKTFVYCCPGAELVQYLNKIHYDEMQNITIFDSSFSWAIDIFEDLTFNNVDEKDVITYFSPPQPIRNLTKIQNDR